MPAPAIDLFSDTMTRPTAAMREAIARAEVGDEHMREDPTVNRLQERVATLLGQEEALFLPTGTMANAIAVRIHCRQGEEIICDTTNHVRHFEAAGFAAFAGASLMAVEGMRGVFTADQVRAALRPDDQHFPRSRLVIVEQTSNMGGGSIWPLETIQEVADAAHTAGLAVHMDGARLMNASVASGMKATALCAPCDSVWLDFSKGLGAPVGACLAGSRSFMKEAWWLKHQFGGSMRQAGVIAAACDYALDHHIVRLAEDHANARLLADGLAAIEGVTVEEPVETNLLFFDVAGLGCTAEEFARRVRERGDVRLCDLAGTRIRACTHLDVTRAQCETALAVMMDVAESLRAVPNH